MLLTSVVKQILKSGKSSANVIRNELNLCNFTDHVGHRSLGQDIVRSNARNLTTDARQLINNKGFRSIVTRSSPEHTASIFSRWLSLGPRLRSLGLQQLRNRTRWGSNNPMNPQSAVYGLLGINAAVWVLWRVDQRLCYRSFTTSWDAVRAGRVHTLVTAAFSQQDFYHLLSNMFGLYFFGRSAAYTLGGKGLIILYLACGIFGNLIYIGGQAMQTSGPHDYYDRSYFYRPNSGTPALGASGAVNGIVIFDCLISPFTQVLIYGIVPVPAIALGAMYLLYDISGALGNGKSNVGYTTHLGGAFIGACAFLGVKTGRIPRQWRRW